MITAPASNAAAELRVVCSGRAAAGRRHDERRPLRIVDVLLHPHMDGVMVYDITSNGTAQQRGGNDTNGRHMGEKGQTRLRCPVCRLDVHAPLDRLRARMDDLSGHPPLTVELSRLHDLLSR